MSPSLLVAFGRGLVLCRRPFSLRNTRRIICCIMKRFLRNTMVSPIAGSADTRVAFSCTCPAYRPRQSIVEVCLGHIFLSSTSPCSLSRFTSLPMLEWPFVRHLLSNRLNFGRLTQFPRFPMLPCLPRPSSPNGLHVQQSSGRASLNLSQPGQESLLSRQASLPDAEETSSKHLFGKCHGR